jgi:hypothetical protein
MLLKKIGSFAVVGALAAAFMLVSVGVSEAKGKKKKAAAAPAKSAICMTGGAPVCATKGGMKFTYANACFAANDGASKAKAGACKPSKGKKAKKAKKAKAKKADAAPAAKPATAAAPAAAKPAATTGAAPAQQKK